MKREEFDCDDRGAAAQYSSIIGTLAGEDDYTPYIPADAPPKFTTPPRRYDRS